MMGIFYFWNDRPFYDKRLLAFDDDRFNAYFRGNIEIRRIK